MLGENGDCPHFFFVIGTFIFSRNVISCVPDTWTFEFNLQIKVGTVFMTWPYDWIGMRPFVSTLK